MEPYKGNLIPVPAEHHPLEISKGTDDQVGEIKNLISNPVPTTKSKDLKGRITVEEKQWKTVFSELINYGIDQKIHNKNNSWTKNKAIEKALQFLGIKETAIDIADHIFRALSEKDLNNGVQYGDEVNLGTKFVANLLTLVNKHLANVSPNDDEAKITEAFKSLIRDLLEITFPKVTESNNKSSGRNLPPILESLVTGKGIHGIFDFLSNPYFEPMMGYPIDQFSWEHLIELIAKYPQQIYMTSYKEIKSVDKSELEKFKGIENLSKDFTKLALKARGLQRIPFDLDSLMLTDKSRALTVESTSLLNTVFVKFLAGRVRTTSKPSVPNDNNVDAKPPVDIVEESWSWFENTFQSAISKILMIVFKPAENQTIDDKYIKFVNELSSKAMAQIPTWNTKIEEIKNKKLHREINYHLNTKLETCGGFYDQEINQLIKKHRNSPEWVQAAQDLAIKICYYEFAENLLKHELNANRFKDILPGLDILPNDYIISFLYDLAGGFLKEFYEHHQSITQQALDCDKDLMKWNIAAKNGVDEVNALIDEKLEDLIIFINKKVDTGMLLENYEFLNKIICHLLKKTAKGKEKTDSEGVKEATLSFARDAIKTIIVKEIGKKIKDGIAPDQALEMIAEELIADGKEAIASIKPNEAEDSLTLISDENDRKKFDTVIEKAYEAYQEIKKSQGNVKLFEIKQKVGSDWKLRETSKKQLLTIFSFSDEFPESETNKRIVDKVMEDAFDLIKDAKPEDTVLTIKEKLFVSWKIKEKTKALFGNILPKKDADLLLSKTLQNKGIWDLVSDGLLSPYLHVFYHNKSVGSQETLNALSLQPLVDKYLPELKKMLINFKTENAIADGLLGGLFGEGGIVNKLFDDAVHPLLMSILAYHVNEKDGVKSEERSAELFWKVLTTIWKSHKEIENLGNNPSTDNVTAIIKKGSSELTDIIIPIELWNKYVPNESQLHLKRQDFIDLTEKLLIGAHAHFAHLETLTKNGEANLGKQQHLGINSFLKSRVADALQVPKKDRKQKEEPEGNQSEVTHNKWIDTVKNNILKMNEADPEKPLNWFIEALSYGIADFLLLSKSEESNGDILGNLEQKLGEVAGMVKKLFDAIDKPDDGLKEITREEKQKYFKMILKQDFEDATAEETLKADYYELIIWVSTKRAIDIIVTDEEWDKIIFPKETENNRDIVKLTKKFITKDLAAGFIAPILKEVYHLRNQLQEDAQVVKEKMIQKDPALAKFAEIPLIQNLNDFISKLGQDPDDLKTLSPFLRTLLVKLFSTKNDDIKNLKERVIEQAVYVLMGQLINLDNPKSSTIINDKINALVSKYTASSDPEIAKANDLAIANELFTVVPEEFWDQYFTGLIGSVVTREAVIDAIVPFISLTRASIGILERETAQAEAFINKIDTKNEIAKQIKDGITTIEKMIDDIGNGKEKVAQKQPELIQNILKKGCKSEVTSPLIKKAIRSLLYVGVHRLLKDEKNELSQEKVMKVFGKIIDILQPGNTTKASATELIKLILPVEMLKTHLPEFLQKSITHEKIVEWFLEDYITEIEKINKAADSYELNGEDEPIGRLQKWIKGQLIGQFKNEDIFGEEGSLLRGAEGKLLNEEKTELTFGNYVDRIVDQVLKLPEAKKFLNTNFLSYALNESLTDIDDVELPEGDFAKLASEKLLSVIFSGATPVAGQPQMPRLANITGIPTMAQNKAFDLTKDGVEKLINNFTNRNERIVFLTGLFAPTDSPVRAKKLKSLEQQIDKKNGVINEPVFLKQSKKLFKSNLVNFVKRQVDAYIDDKKWSKPLTAIAKFFLNIVVSIAMHISIKHRVWNFVSNEQNDKKIRKLIWKFTDTANNYKDEKVEAGDLAKTMKNALGAFKLLPFDLVRKKAGGAIETYLSATTDKEGKELIPGKTFIDILAGPAPKKAVPPIK